MVALSRRLGSGGFFCWRLSNLLAASLSWSWEYEVGTLIGRFEVRSGCGAVRLAASIALFNLDRLDYVFRHVFNRGARSQNLSLVNNGSGQFTI